MGSRKLIRGRSRVSLLLTFALILICFTNVTAIRVVFSLYALDLGAQASGVGLLAATFYGFPLLLSWAVGSWSDRVGARWLLFFGTISGACGMLVPYLLRDLPALYWGGALIGLSFSFYNVLLQNLVGLLSDLRDRARNFGTSSVLGASSGFLGPLLGGIAVDHAGAAMACLYVAALPVTAAALLALFGGVLPRRTRPAASTGGILATLTDKGVLRLLATSALVQAGQDLFQFYMPIYGHAKGLSGSAIGGVIASFAAAAVVVRFVMPRLLVLMGENRLIASSFYVSSIAFLLLPMFENGVALGAIAFLFGLGMGCGQPITTMLMFSQSAEGRSGETLGLRLSVNNAVRVSAPALFGFVASAFGLPVVFWITAFTMLGGGWLAGVDDQTSH